MRKLLFFASMVIANIANAQSSSLKFDDLNFIINWTNPELVDSTVVTVTDTTGNHVVYSAKTSPRDTIVVTPGYNSTRYVFSLVNYRNGYPSDPVIKTFDFNSSKFYSNANVKISCAYLTQAIQTCNNMDEIVIHRDALARIFVTSDTSGIPVPSVRLNVYSGSTLKTSYNLTSASTTIPGTVNEGSLNASWNVRIPKEYITSDLRLEATVQSLRLRERNKTDNAWKSDTGSNHVKMFSHSPIKITFVPVKVGSLTGNVTPSTKENWMKLIRQLWPLDSVVVSVRDTFISPTAALVSGGDGWSTVLSQMNQLRSLDGVYTQDTYYVGVVKTNYGSGVAGIGYQPGWATVAWDASGTYQRVIAHEIGHNFGLGHSPCGVAGSPIFPYSDGRTNAWGWDNISNALYGPTYKDVMSYCEPQWVSDYNWSRVVEMLAYRSPPIYIVAINGKLVSGSISSNGVVKLNPMVTVRNAVQSKGGNYRVELKDVNGSILGWDTFGLDTIDHVDEYQFNTVVGIPDSDFTKIVQVTLYNDHGQVIYDKIKTTDSSVVSFGAIFRESGDQTIFIWDTDAYPQIIIRYANGKVKAMLTTSGSSLVLSPTDRVYLMDGFDEIDITNKNNNVKKR